MCPHRTIFPTGLGGFARNAVFDSRFCYKIPDGIEPKYAGPLMCAGATVFAAMNTYKLKPTDRIGIVGIGGLGHLALQFAHAWGCHVVAISTNYVSCCSAHESTNSMHLTTSCVTL
jgi:D-arabinose 1-dehydrogenase-like Zn-dependent alcohol dehydrogenase